jgi:hypothetical protein
VPVYLAPLGNLRDCPRKAARSRFAFDHPTPLTGTRPVSVVVALTRCRSPVPSSCFPPTVLLPDASLPSPGSSMGRVPRLLRYYRGATTSCRPSRRTSFSFVWRYHGITHVSLPASLRATTSDLELVTRYLPPGIVVETTGSPMFLGNPDCVSALLSDPGGPTASGLCDATARPPF